MYFALICCNISSVVPCSVRDETLVNSAHKFMCCVLLFNFISFCVLWHNVRVHLFDFASFYFFHACGSCVHVFSFIVYSECRSFGIAMAVYTAIGKSDRYSSHVLFFVTHLRGPLFINHPLTSSNSSVQVNVLADKSNQNKNNILSEFFFCSRILCSL